MDRTRVALGFGSWLLIAWTALAAEVPAANVDDEVLRKQALALNELTGDDPLKGAIETLLADKVQAKKLLAVAVALSKDKPQPLNFNAAFVLASVAGKLKDVNSADTFYRLAGEEARKLKSAEKLYQSFGGLIDLLYAQDKFDESETVCKEFLELDEDEAGRMKAYKSAALRRLIQNIAKQGKVAEALKLTDNYIKARRGHWLAYELKGWVLRELNRLDDSAKVYLEVLDKIAADETLEKAEKADFTESCRYILSGVYVDLGKIDKGAEQLKAILERKPDEPTYNNDLGYIWADHDMNLDEAEKLIRKALEEDKKRRKEKDPKLKDDHDNAAYLDSMGWVLFKKKQYKEAKDFLLKAVQDKKDGQHIEIYDHLGDVHKALGEKAEAVTAWKKGLKVVGKNKREQEKKVQVEKKIKAAE